MYLSFIYSLPFPRNDKSLIKPFVEMLLSNKRRKIKLYINNFLLKSKGAREGMDIVVKFVYRVRRLSDGETKERIPI